MLRNFKKRKQNLCSDCKEQVVYNYVLAKLVPVVYDLDFHILVYRNFFELINYYLGSLREDKDCPHNLQSSCTATLAHCLHLYSKCLY